MSAPLEATQLPHAQDFEAALDMRLTDLRKSLQWEHDRVARMREGWLWEEVARLRHELAALQAGGGVRIDCGGFGEATQKPYMELSTEASPAPKPTLLEWSAHLAAPPPEQNVSSQAEGRPVSYHSVRSSQTLSNQAFNQIMSATEQFEHSRRFGQEQRKAKRKLTSHERIEQYLDPLMCFVVLLNTLVIGVSIDVYPEWTGWTWVDSGFIALYLGEFWIKLHCFGLKGYFRGPGCGWNVFDFVIVLLSIMDFGVSLAYQDEGVDPPSFVFIRLVRITRFSRIMRLFQFEVLRELLTMVNGLVSALRTLIWAGVLLFFPIYILGMLLTSLVGQAPDAPKKAKESFGHLRMSMFMVFRCTVGDCSLADGTPVILFLTEEYGWIYGVTYVLVIMLVTFGIFNLIMATFVDNALATARRNESVRVRTRLNDQERQTQKTSALVYRLWEFQNAQLPESKRSDSFRMESVTQMRISKEVFDLAIQDPEAQQLLEDLDVPEDDRSGLFDVLDADGGGTLHMDELVGGLIRLRGDPRRSDVVHVAIVVRALQDQLRTLGARIRRDLGKVYSAVHYVSLGKEVDLNSFLHGRSLSSSSQVSAEEGAVYAALEETYGLSSLAEDNGDTWDCETTSTVSI